MASKVKQAEVYPVSPKQGAYVRQIPPDGTHHSPLLRFDGWLGDTKFSVQGSTEEYDADTFEALTPAYYGFGYDKAVCIPPGSWPGYDCRIDGWSSIEPLVAMPGQMTQHWNSNAVAALAPMLNPATETPEEAVARLMREKERIEMGLRNRMVAEGVYRNWCSEFDPILDSNGLPPRKHKGFITGTATFRVELSGYDLSDPDVLAQIKNSPTSFISHSAFRVESLEAEPNANAPMLST